MGPLDKNCVACWSGVTCCVAPVMNASLVDHLALWVDHQVLTTDQFYRFANKYLQFNWSLRLSMAPKFIYAMVKRHYPLSHMCIKKAKHFYFCFLTHFNLTYIKHFGELKNSFHRPCSFSADWSNTTNIFSSQNGNRNSIWTCGVDLLWVRLTPVFVFYSI